MSDNVFFNKGQNIQNLVTELKKADLNQDELQQLNTVWSFDTENEYGTKSLKGDGYLNKNELSMWLFSISFSLRQKVEKFVAEQERVNILSNLGLEINKVNSKENDLKKDIETAKDLIRAEVEKHTDVNIKNVDVDYWANLIAKNSKGCNIPMNILVSIIGQETNGTFGKKIISSNGNSAMGITTSVPADMLDNYRARVYKRLDENLYNEIISIAKKKNCLSATGIRNACGKDNDFAIKVGALAFKMKLATAVSKRLGISLFKAIDLLKENPSICIEADIKVAARDYNGAKGIKEKYANNVIKSLKSQNYDFQSRIV